MQREGMGEIMETLCGTDWLLFKMQHGVLRRNCTLAAGRSMCDYRAVGEGVKDPKKSASGPQSEGFRIFCFAQLCR